MAFYLRFHIIFIQYVFVYLLLDHFFPISMDIYAASFITFIFAPTYKID